MPLFLRHLRFSFHCRSPLIAFFHFRRFHCRFRCFSMLSFDGLILIIIYFVITMIAFAAFRR